MSANRLGVALLVVVLVVGVWGGATAAAATAPDQRTDAVCAAPMATGVPAATNGVPVGADATLTTDGTLDSGHAPVDTLESGQASTQILAPADADTFHRGDVVPIELALGAGERATLTISDPGGDVLDVDVTVQDVNRDGKARILLNTFQIGNETRDHGVVTRDHSTGIERVDARTAAGDGPGGDGVLPAGNYTLAVASGGGTVAGEDAADTAVLRLAERGIGDLRVRTAPATASFAPDTVADIEAAIDDGLVTEDRRIADGDYFVLSVPATGLGGVLHEAAIRSPALDDPAAFLDRVRRDDRADRVGDAFLAATQFDGSPHVDRVGGSLTVGNLSAAPPRPVLGIGTVQIDIGTCEPITAIDMENASTAVLAGTDSTGSIDRYHVVATLETGAESLTPGSGNDLYRSEFASYVTVRPVDPDANRTAPPLARSAGTADESADAHDTTAGAIAAADGGVGSIATWSFHENHIPTIDSWRGLPLVANTTGATLGGPTPLAAGTELAVTVETPEGRNPSLERTETTRVEHVPGEPNAWNVTVDLDGYPAGTLIDVRVSRAGGETPLTEEPLRAVLVEEPRVDEFVFRNQTAATHRGVPVVVGTLDTTHGGRIVLSDADGDRIGSSPILPRGNHDEVRIELDRALEEPTAITAVVYRGPDEPYEAGGERVERTAVVTPGALEPASFTVVSVDPEAEQLDEPRDVEVSVVVENDGVGQGEQTVTLSVDKRLIDSERVAADSGERAGLTFEIPASAIDDAETHRVTVRAGADGVSHDLTVGPSSDDPAFTIDAVQDPTDALDKPQDVDVPVTVTNTGGSGTARVELVFDDSVVATAEPSLDAGETATLSLSIPADELLDGQPTTFRVQTAVDSEGGIVAVNKASVTPTPTDTETWLDIATANGTADADSSTRAERGPTDTAAASDDGPGFGAVGALVALALGAALAARSRRG